MAAGPIGRNAEASGTASIKSIAAVYSYSKTRGLFAGVSLEGSVILERFDANAKMYGRKVATRELLNGTIPPPPQADSLYRALESRFHGRSTAGGYNSGLNRSATTGGRFSFMNNNNGGDDFSDSGYGRGNNDFGRGDFGRSDFARGNTDYGRGLGRAGTVSNSMYNSEPVYGETFVDKQASAYSRGNDGYGGGYGTSQGFDSPVRSSTETRARAMFNFAGEQDGDLPFKKGDIITITKKTDTNNDWWTGTFNSRTGIVSMARFHVQAQRFSPFFFLSLRSFPLTL